MKSFGQFADFAAGAKLASTDARFRNGVEDLAADQEQSRASRIQRHPDDADGIGHAAAIDRSSALKEMPRYLRIAVGPYGV
jgi:hypothetical protein